LTKNPKKKAESMSKSSAGEFELFFLAWGILFFLTPVIFPPALWFADWVAHVTGLIHLA
jgi:hypothetical protein